MPIHAIDPLLGSRPNNPNSVPMPHRTTRLCTAQRDVLGVIAAGSLTLTVLSGAWVATAQSVPPLINYQGQLTDANGAPLPTADYTLTFSLYAVASGGSPVWGPQVFDGASAAGHGPKIPVVQGYFNVMLGPTDTAARSLVNAFAASPRYLEIKVGSNQAIDPRQQILSTPFAIAADRARIAESVGGGVLNTAENGLYIRSASPSLRLETTTGTSADWYVFGHPVDGSLTFHDGLRGSTRMVISANGAVGIGNNQPGAQLQVNRQDGGSAAIVAGIGDQTVPAAVNSTVVSLTTSSSAYRMYAGYRDGEERFHVGNDGGAYFGGSVGIGTTTREAGLHVDTGTGSDVAYFDSGGATARINFRAQGPDGRTWGVETTSGAFNISDRTANADRLTIKPDGNVGIGITSPQATLDVAGTLKIAKMAQQSVGGANGYIQIGEVILQWAQESDYHDINSSSTTTLSFPKPFPNEVFVVIPAINNHEGYRMAVTLMVQSVNVRQVTLRWDEWAGNSQRVKASFIAIGR